MMEASDAPAKMKHSAKLRRYESRSQKGNNEKQYFAIMDEKSAERLRARYQEKVNHIMYELVAGFKLEGGVIQSYYVFRTRLNFELTERRRRLLARYYRPGHQEVVLYVNGAEFEHYMPITYYKTKTAPCDSAKVFSELSRGREHNTQATDDEHTKSDNSKLSWIRFGHKK